MRDQLKNTTKLFSCWSSARVGQARAHPNEFVQHVFELPLREVISLTSLDLTLSDSIPGGYRNLIILLPRIKTLRLNCSSNQLPMEQLEILVVLPNLKTLELYTQTATNIEYSSFIWANLVVQWYAVGGTV
jgi:hypothetical protein